MAIGYKQMIEAAEKEVKTIEVDEAKASLDDDGVVFVDLRDVRELHREGKIPGAYHAPRGMLEFWVDPDSPYHHEIFSQEKQFVFYCASAWRSALAAQTVQKMGMTNVCHLGGGFSAWKKANCPVEELERKS